MKSLGIGDLKDKSMENKVFNMPAISTKYIIRKTGEEVEVIDFDVKERGDRSDEDWVTYIDSKGEEHLKEHLNLMLDFKPSEDFRNMFNKVFSDDWKKGMPRTDNARVYEVTKGLVVQRGWDPDDAYNKAKRVVELCMEAVGPQ